jgi:hypothetical protein
LLSHLLAALRFAKVLVSGPAGSSSLSLFSHYSVPLFAALAASILLVRLFAVLRFVVIVPAFIADFHINPFVDCAAV